METDGMNNMSSASPGGRTLSTSSGEIAHLYLELLKRTLTRYEMEDVERLPIVGRSRVRRALLGPVQLGFRQLGLEIVRTRPVQQDLRRLGRDHPQNADTMIGMERLNNIQMSIESIVKEDVPGDLIETGVWRGGAGIFMRAVLKTLGISDRKVWLADSFRGLPPPDPGANPADAGDRHFKNAFLAVPRAEVERRFSSYGLLDDQVRFLEGWFSDTLPKLPAKVLALVRLDGDMYGSTMCALENLYPRLASGGFLIVDDFHLSGCREAVGDFRRVNAISEEILPIDGWSVYWRKRTKAC